MTGASPVTVTFAVVASVIVASTTTVLSSWMRVFFSTFPKLASVNVTVYSPGGSSGMRKVPSPAVVADLTPCRDGLFASTETPGSTPPVPSFT